MRIVVLNCNTTASMTETIRLGAVEAAAPGTEIIALTPDWGPASVEGFYESFIAAAAMLDKLTTFDEQYDGVIMAGFGEHGREGAREWLSVPVVDITEAAGHMASLLGHKYGVVTTLDRAVGQIEDSLKLAGLMENCAAVTSTGLGVLELDEDEERTERAFIEAGREAIKAGAEVLTLGCAGMSGLQVRMAQELGVPVVDGVAAAVKLVEGLVHMKLSTSKIRSYAYPLDKPRPGWPVSKN
jgi:allantoin racemase